VVTNLPFPGLALSPSESCSGRLCSNTISNRNGYVVVDIQTVPYLGNWNCVPIYQEIMFLQATCTLQNAGMSLLSNIDSIAVSHANTNECHMI